MIRTLFVLLGVQLVVLFVAFPPFAYSAPPQPTVHIAKDVQFIYPAAWKPIERGYRNATELVMEKGQGRVLVTSEERIDTADARRRLEEIAAEYPAAAARYLTIGGWPAVQRRYAVALERRGAPEEEPEEFEAPGESTISQRLTTAIAVGKRIVRMETTIAPKADIKLLARAEQACQAIVAAKPVAADVSAIKDAVLKMQARFDKLRRAQTPSGAPDTAPKKPRSPNAAATSPSTVTTIDLTKSQPPSDTLSAANEIGAMTPSTTGAGVLVPGTAGELEVAASNDGRNVVVATNGGFANSTDGGQTFVNRGATPGAFPRDGDPSLGVGASGAFYYGFIGFPNGTAAANNVTGCSTGIAVSTNNGQTFTFRNHATLCPNGAAACFPDQEHITADRANAAANNGDQVYSVWRSFVPVTPGPNVQCNGIGTGFVTPSLVCSADGGTNWTAPLALGAGDFPRVAAGRDGAVYVAYRSGANLMIDKFSSCANGLNRQTGFPIVAATVNDVVCPVPGLDRCNNGNTLSSQTVATDETNAQHVFVAFANSNGASDDVMVRESTDGGRTFPRAVQLNTNSNGHRFMPWVCAQGGTAFVSWYDRRRAGQVVSIDSACEARCVEQRDLCLEDAVDLPKPGRPFCFSRYRTCHSRCERRATNDLTQYFWASARPSGGVLIASNETNLSGNNAADPQCASGWQCAPRAVNDSESCSVQPQAAGICCAPGANCPGSRQRCDFSSPGCPVGESCFAGGGCPKYGDYNGNACAGGRAFFAWASATTPAGAAAGNGIRVFSAATPPPATLTIRKTVSPANDSSRFSLTVDGTVRAANVGNGGSSGPLLITPGTHSIGERAGASTSLLNYTTTIGGDCTGNGAITLNTGDTKTCTITNTRVSRAECLQECRADRDDCMSEVGTPGGPRPAQCVQMFNGCRIRCSSL